MKKEDIRSIKIRTLDRYNDIVNKLKELGFTISKDYGTQQYPFLYTYGDRIIPDSSEKFFLQCDIVYEEISIEDLLGREEQTLEIINQVNSNFKDWYKVK